MLKVQAFNENEIFCDFLFKHGLPNKNISGKRKGDYFQSPETKQLFHLKEEIRHYNPLL